MRAGQAEPADCCLWSPVLPLGDRSAFQAPHCAPAALRPGRTSHSVSEEVISTISTHKNPVLSTGIEKEAYFLTTKKN